MKITEPDELGEGPTSLDVQVHNQKHGHQKPVKPNKTALEITMKVVTL